MRVSRMVLECGENRRFTFLSGERPASGERQRVGKGPTKKGKAAILAALQRATSSRASGRCKRVWLSRLPVMAAEEGQEQQRLDGGHADIGTVGPGRTHVPARHGQR